MNFWFFRKQLISDGSTQYQSNRPLSQSEVGIQLIASENDALLTQNLVVQPIRVANVFTSDVERVAYTSGLVDSDNNAVFFQQSDASFWQWTSASGWAPYTPVWTEITGGGGSGGSAGNTLTVTVHYDEAPVAYPIDQLVCYLPSIDQSIINYDGTGSDRNFVLHTDLDAGLPGDAGTDGVLYVAANNNHNTIWVYSIPFTAANRPTGTLVGSIAITAETTVEGVDGVFTGKTGTIVQAPQGTRDVAFQFVLDNASKTILNGPNQPYTASITIGSTTHTGNATNPIDLAGWEVDFAALPVGVVAGTITVTDSVGGVPISLLDGRSFTFVLPGISTDAYSPIVSLTSSDGLHVTPTGDGLTLE